MPRDRSHAMSYWEERCLKAEAQLQTAEQEREKLLAWAIEERAEWEDTNADRYWQMNRVVEQFGKGPQ